MTMDQGTRLGALAIILALLRAVPAAAAVAAVADLSDLPPRTQVDAFYLLLYSGALYNDEETMACLEARDKNADAVVRPKLGAVANATQKLRYVGLALRNIEDRDASKHLCSCAEAANPLNRGRGVDPRCYCSLWILGGSGSASSACGNAITGGVMPGERIAYQFYEYGDFTGGHFNLCSKSSNLGSLCEKMWAIGDQKDLKPLLEELEKRSLVSIDWTNDRSGEVTVLADECRVVQGRLVSCRLDPVRLKNAGRGVDATKR